MPSNSCFHFPFAFDSHLQLELSHFVKLCCIQQKDFTTKSVFVHTYWFSAKRALSEPQSHMSAQATTKTTANSSCMQANPSRWTTCSKRLRIKAGCLANGQCCDGFNLDHQIKKSTRLLQSGIIRISSLILPEVPRVRCEVWAFIFIIITACTIHFRSLDLVSEP